MTEIKKPKEPEARKMEKKPPSAEETSKPKAESPPKKEATTAPKPAVTQPPVAASSSTGKPRAAFVDPSLQAVDTLECEAIAIGLAQDVRPLAGLAGVLDWRLCGRLSDLLRKGVVTGKAKELVLMPTLNLVPSKRIFLFGWGPRSAMLDGATEKMAWMVEVLKKAQVDRVALALPEPSAMLLGLVEEHLKKPLGDKLGVVFGPDSMLPAHDTRPIPAPALTGRSDEGPQKPPSPA